MTEIIQGKTLVGTVVNAVNRAKVYGELGLRNMYLLSIVGELLVNFKDLTFEQRQRLETLYNFIKYNDKDICNYRQKDLTSFKSVKFCPDCPSNRTLRSVNQAPTITNISRTITADYTFVREDFIQSFADPNNDQPGTVRIVSLPTMGIIQFNGTAITAGFEFNIAQVGNLRYILTNTNSPIVQTFTFQTSDNDINKLFSNMATFTLNIQAAVNQPPSAVGDNSRTLANGSTYTFTVADFTTGTTPPYADPEGDQASMLRVTALPTDGDLQFNGVNMTLNQVIPFSGATSIASGALRYVTEQNAPAMDTETFEFEISDTGSNTFVG